MEVTYFLNTLCLYSCSGFCFWFFVFFCFPTSELKVPQVKSEIKKKKEVLCQRHTKGVKKHLVTERRIGLKNFKGCLGFFLWSDDHFHWKLAVFTSMLEKDHHKYSHFVLRIF